MTWTSHQFGVIAPAAAKDQFDGQLHIFVNHANVGSDVAKLTEDNIEYNTGCNFVANHYLIILMLPLLLKTASSVAALADAAFTIIAFGYHFRCCRSHFSQTC